MIVYVLSVIILPAESADVSRITTVSGIKCYSEYRAPRCMI